MARGIASVSAALFVFSVLLAGPAMAGELRDGASLISGMVGYTSHESQQSGDQIGGGSWSFDYARVGKGGKWSAGVVMRRMESDEFFQDENAGGQEVRVNAKRLVTAVQGTFFFLDGRFSPYVNGMAGVHMQTSDVYRDGEPDFRQSSQTFAAGFSGGTHFHVTSGIFLRAEYTFHYFASSDTISKNHMHGFYGGLGFQFGG